LSSAGVLSWKQPVGANYEASSPNNTYHLQVMGTDAGGNVVTQNLTVNVTNVNEPPQAYLSSGGATHIGSNTAITLAAGSFGNVVISDPDSANTLLYATLTTSGGSVSGITDVNPSLPGVQFSGTAAQLQSQLASLSYADDPSAANRKGDVALSLRVSQVGFSDTSQAGSVTIPLVLRGPALSHDNAPALTYNEVAGQSSTLPVLGSVQVIQPAADAPLLQATILLDTSQSGDALSLALNPFTMGNNLVQSISNPSSTSTLLTLTSTGGTTAAQWQAALQAVTYSSSAHGTTGTRNITTTVTDTQGQSTQWAQSLSVTSTPDTPTLNLMPSSASAPENIQLGTVAALGKLITGASGASTYATFNVADLDNHILYLTLTATNGHLQGFPTSGLTIITQNDGSTVQLSGTASAIDTWLSAQTTSSNSVGFVATAAGAASLGFQLSTVSFADTSAATSVSGTYQLQASSNADNQAPVLSAITPSHTSFDSPENTPVTTAIGRLSDLFTANEAVVWSFVNGSNVDNAFFNIDPVTGALYWKNVPNYESTTTLSAAGTHTYTVKLHASDLAGNGVDQQISVNLTNVNEAPLRTDTHTFESLQTILPTSATWSQSLSGYFQNQDSSLTQTYTMTAAAGTTLPAWLSLNPSTGALGVVSGQSLPTSNTTVAFTLTDTNAGGSTSVPVQISFVGPQTVPTITGISAVDTTSHNPAIGHAGDSLTVYITLDQDVTLTAGTPQAQFNFNGSSTSTVSGTYVGDQDGVLSFTVTAPSGLDASTIGLNSLSVSGGSFHMTANNAVLGNIINSPSNLTAPFALDNTAPLAPVVNLGASIVSGASPLVNDAQATQASGVVTVLSEPGSSVAVIFTGAGGASVTHTVTGDVSKVPVVLTEADLNTLGDGFVGVSAIATDLAGNTSPVGGTSFVLDHTPPTLGNLGTAPTSVAQGATWALPNISVASTNASDMLTLSVLVSAGTLSIAGVTDADPNTPGLQVMGTASMLQTDLAHAVYTAPGAATNNATVQVSVSDAAGNPASHLYTFNVI
jgi:hypothetical protein